MGTNVIYAIPKVVQPSINLKSYYCSLNIEWLLAATKQIYEWFSPSVRPSVCLSVCLSVRLSVTPFYYIPIIVSSWNFHELLPLTEVMPMQMVKVRGRRSMSQRSKPNLAIFWTVTLVWIINFDPNLAFPDCNCILNWPMDMKWCTKLEVA